jgi:excisionase family DNA binding protein
MQPLSASDFHTGAPRDEGSFAARYAALSPELQAHVRALAWEMLTLASDAVRTGAVVPATAPEPHGPASAAPEKVRPPDGLLDVDGVAARLGVSARTVERIIKAGELRPIRVSGQRRFHTATVEAYLRDAARRPRSTRRRTKRTGGKA